MDKVNLLRTLALICILSVFFLFSCTNTVQKEKKQDNPEKVKISSKWYGTYTLSIGGENEDWRDIKDISLKITKDSILFHAEGYQLDQNYRLTATESDSGLNLHYKNAADNSESAVLRKTKDFGTITSKGKTYKWYSPYVVISFAGSKSGNYTLIKK